MQEDWFRPLRVGIDVATIVWIGHGEAPKCQVREKWGGAGV